MAISPPALTLGTTALIGGGATAAMATTSPETARKVRMGTNIFGLTGAGVALSVAGLGAANAGDSYNAAKGIGIWANQQAKFTGMHKSAQLALIGGSVAAGVAAANMAASWVLDINDRSLAGS